MVGYAVYQCSIQVKNYSFCLHLIKVIANLFFILIVFFCKWFFLVAFSGNYFFCNLYLFSRADFFCEPSFFVIFFWTDLFFLFLKLKFFLSCLAWFFLSDLFFLAVFFLFLNLKIFFLVLFLQAEFFWSIFLFFWLGVFVFFFASRFFWFFLI
jgi:hypothetical protein